MPLRERRTVAGTTAEAQSRAWMGVRKGGGGMATREGGVVLRRTELQHPMGGTVPVPGHR